MGILKAVAVLLHTGGAAIMTYAWMQLDHLPNNAWVSKQKGGHLQFLTIQGFGFSLRILNSSVNDIFFAVPGLLSHGSLWLSV